MTDVEQTARAFKTAWFAKAARKMADAKKLEGTLSYDKESVGGGG